MKPTGVHSHEPSKKRLTALKRPFLHLGTCGLALAAVIGTASPSQAGHADPTKPRVERVLDVDGSVWEVLIVPRPLYTPPPIHCPPVLDAAPADSVPVVPPAPKEEAQEKKAQPKPKAVPKPKAKPDTYEAAPSPPPPPKKEKADQKDALHVLPDTELIAVQADNAKPAKKDDKQAKPKKDDNKAEVLPAEDDAFGVEIVPRFSYPVRAPSAACCPPDAPAAHVNPEDYAWVYHSIPFIRSEYIANPSYRHEATMEILFGQLRPTVVHKHPGQPRPHETLFPFENDIIRPYSYYSLGPGAGYGRGPLPFAAPGAYGVNYNFYYPMPTVYRAY